MEEVPEYLALTPAQLKMGYGLFLSQKELLTEMFGVCFVDT
jgi:hypothetical protein